MMNFLFKLEKKIWDQEIKILVKKFSNLDLSQMVQTSESREF